MANIWRNFAARFAERLAEREAERQAAYRAIHGTSRVADQDKTTFTQGVCIVAFSYCATEFLIRAGYCPYRRIREFTEGKARQLAAQFVPRETMMKDEQLARARKD